MLYQFPSDISAWLDACLGSGADQNQDEVPRDALEQREQEKIRRWNEGNQIAMEQSRQGLSQPLDDAAVIDRLQKRLAAEGIVEECRAPFGLSGMK